MSRLRELREQAGLTVFELAGEAKVSISTVNRMERGDSVTRTTAYKVLNVLSSRLGRRFETDDIEGLHIKPGK